jgi:hypothetical protein
LGFSIILFVVTFGILFYLMPMIIGAFITALPASSPMLNATWQATNLRVQTIIQWLIPLTASLGIFIFVVKVMMVATTRGGD